MPIARDLQLAAPRNRARDLGCPAAPASGVKYADEGTIYYESRIGRRGLLDGWRGVQMGVNDRANPPIGLSPWPVYGAEDEMALKLSTGEKSYVVGNYDNQCTTWRGTQLSAIKERFIKYSIRFSLMDGTFSLAWDSFCIGMDMQSQDNTQRSLVMFAVRNTYNGDDTHPYTKASITRDIDHNFVDISGASDNVPGANEGKMSETIMTLVWDRQATPTTSGGYTGYGRPHSAQIGGFHVDLTTSAIRTAAGSSIDPPQLPDPSAHTTIEDFRDTLNLGLILNRSTSGTQADTHPAVAKVSGIVLSGHDLA